MDQWINNGQFIEFYPCITLPSLDAFDRSVEELSLSGSGGEIWVGNPVARSKGEAVRYKAVCFERDGSESLHEFGAEDLAEWVKRLKISRDRNEQIKYANAFGKHLL
jgi:hypothetical protein